MKTYFPYYFRKIGIAFVIIALGLSIYANINDCIKGWNEGRIDAMNVSKQKKQELKSNLQEPNIIPEERSKKFIWISLTFSFAGFLLYMFSKEKIEDEFIQKLRFISLAKSLLFTWIFITPFIIFDLRYKIDGLYILQFQLIFYVIIYNYYKKWKFGGE